MIDRKLSQLNREGERKKVKIINSINNKKKKIKLKIYYRLEEKNNVMCVRVCLHDKVMIVIVIVNEEKKNNLQVH